jgi:hydroxymethylpyrimidine/phosphomethylpyrimidine kinase
MPTPTILTLAGSDSSGGAGIQADLKAISANGGYGASVLTAITAQNTCGVLDAETVPVTMIRSQIEAVFTDLKVAACKTGMMASEDVIETVAEGLARYRPPWYVCDPVMISKSGYALLPDHCIESLKRSLLPLASVVTPNAHEAEALAGFPVRSVEDAERAGREILAIGPGAVLVKGGHLDSAEAVDVLVSEGGMRIFPGERIDSKHTHGTGCTYSAAIATWLGRGATMERAVESAKRFVTEAIRHGLPVGKGVGPTDPFFFLRAGTDGDRWVSRIRNEDEDGA